MLQDPVQDGILYLALYIFRLLLFVIISQTFMVDLDSFEEYWVRYIV